MSLRAIPYESGHELPNELIMPTQSDKMTKINSSSLSTNLLPLTSLNVAIFGRMSSRNEKMKSIFKTAEKVARSNSTVLILGETGTGKELIASGIHKMSVRRDKPFIAINCSAIPEHLLESELFGHKKGSFTGANEARRGIFEEGNGGTIFLDEVGDMPFELQAKLLRVIQEREIRPVGENKSKPIDVRIIAATHKDLSRLVIDGKFREDFYYRLSVVPIHLPSLRERKEDIIHLAQLFLEKYCLKNQTFEKHFSKTALAKLQAQPWSGNVRELENTIERAVVLSDQEKIIEEHDIQDEIILPTQSQSEVIFSNLITLEELEKKYIQYVLAKTGKSKEKSATILGINRKTLYRKEIAYGIFENMA